MEYFIERDRIILSLLKNPFFLYCTTLCIVIILYVLGWSELFPPLSEDVIFFFIVTFIISILCGHFIQNKKPIEYTEVHPLGTRKVLIIIYLLYSISFIYNGGIPLVLILSKTDFFYKDFYGIPYFQSIITTFTAFYTAYLFHVYISKKNNYNLINLFFILLIPLLIYNRGMLIISLVNFTIIFFMSKSEIKLKSWLIIGFITLLALFFFGVLGNHRTKQSSNENMLNVVGKASKKFKASVVPKEYFWSYIYIASPLANFQETVNNNPNINNKWVEFSVFELLPNFISKRIGKRFNLQQEQIDQVSPHLTVGTLYAMSFKFLGWIGPIILYMYVIIIVSLYWFIVDKKNPFYVTGFSFLGVFIVFNFFDNMISVGFSLHLFYPIIFQFFIKNKILA